MKGESFIPVVLSDLLNHAAKGVVSDCEQYRSRPLDLPLLIAMSSSVNVPWPEKGMGDAEYIYAFQKVIMPIALEFAPELVISKTFACSPFDAHFDIFQFRLVSMQLQVMILGNVSFLPKDMLI
jgi:hypothetical protein